MSIYDSYKLSNSTAIPKFEGSAGQESIQVGQYMQGLYDQASQGAGVISSASDNIPAMLEDQGHATELRNKVKTSVDTWSKAKNWEDYLPDVQTLGREYASRAAELAAPVKQYADWREKVLEDKDKNLTSDQKDSLDAMERSKYKGLKKDAMGRLVGEFKGGRVAKNIDINEWTDKVLKDRVIQQGGTDYSNDNGIIKFRKEGHWQTFSGDRIKQILAEARENDAEYKDFARQEADISGFKGSKVTDLNMLSGSTKANAEKLVKLGYSIPEASARAMAYGRNIDLKTSMENYALQKYTQNDQWRKVEEGIGDIAKAAATKRNEDGPRLVGQGVNTIPEYAKDPVKLTKEIETGAETLLKLKQDAAILERKLNTPGGNTTINLTEKDRLKQQIAQAEKVQTNNQSLWNTSRDLAISKMNRTDGKGGIISTYKQYVESELPRLTEKIKAKTSAIKKNGITYTPEQIAEAILNGGLRTTSELERKPIKGSGINTFTGQKLQRGDGTNQFTAGRTYLVMPDGTKLESGTGSLNFLSVISADMKRQLKAIDKGAHELHSEAIKNASVKPDAIGFNKSEREQLANMGLASATIYARPGSDDISSDESLRGKPVEFKYYSPQTGRLTVDIKNEDGTFTQTEVSMKTNIGNMLRNSLSAENIDGSMTPYIRSLDDASYSGILKNVKPGTTLSRPPGIDGLEDPDKPAFEWNGKPMYIDFEQNSKEYVLKGEDNKPVVGKDGKQYRTTSITDADTWMQGMIPKEK